MKPKQFLPIMMLAILLVTPLACADDGDWQDWDWHDIGKDVADSFDWNHIGESIAGSFYDFILNLVNSPMQPLLDAVKNLLKEKIDAGLFSNIWAIVAYTISLFYGLLFLYSGFNFIISGNDPAKRENAKQALQNTVIMVVLVNASFFIYSTLIEISSLLTEGVLGLIDGNFFNMVSGNIGNAGTEFFMGMTYVIILLLTLIILSVRYIIVAFGAAFFPLGIFLYFIQPLKSYGKMIVNFLGVNIFASFASALILLISSKASQITYFANFKILLMCSAFAICDLMLIYLMFFAAIKAAVSTAGKVIAIKSGPIGIAAAAISSSLSKKQPQQSSLKEFS